MSHPRPTRSRAGLALAAVFGLVLALVQGVAGPAAAVPVPAPTSMVVRAYSDPATTAGIAGAPLGAIPEVLAATGDSFVLEVTLKAGPLDAAFSSDTAVSFTATGPGALSSTPGVIRGGTTTSVFTVSYDKVATGVTITARAGKGNKAVAGTSNAFDITKFLTFVAGDEPSLKNGTAGTDGAGCAVVDRANPLCGIVTLPDGASGDVALSLGLCPADANCQYGNLVTQMIADLTADGVNLYGRDDPARMELICDKSLCGKGGVPSFTALWSESATGALAPVQGCSVKGVIDADLDYCTDYRESRRDGAGDLHLIVLFFKDVRGGI